MSGMRRHWHFNQLLLVTLLCSPSYGDDQHWSFRKITRPTPPRVRQSDWPRNGSDSFVLARLEKGDVAPSPEADRVTSRVVLTTWGARPL